MKNSFLTSAVLAITLVVPGFAQDLTDSVPAARTIVARHFRNAKLESVCGTQAFDATGRQTGKVFLNFTGQDETGKRMLMSLTVEKDGTVTGESDPNNPRKDAYSSFANPDLRFERWLSPEEAVLRAVRLHPRHAPDSPVSLSYGWSSEYGKRPVMVLYWVSGAISYYVAIDARYGHIVAQGEGLTIGT